MTFSVFIAKDWKLKIKYLISSSSQKFHKNVKAQFFFIAIINLEDIRYLTGIKYLNYFAVI